MTLYLNDQPVPEGYLHLRPDGGPAQRWPILSAVLDGRLDADFTYTFRLADPQNRLRFLTVLGLGYGVDKLRFRAFEGYLIFPGAGGTVSRQEPMYAIDFGYRWPEPPRHVRMAQRLATLTASLEEGGRSLSAAREARADAEKVQKTLQAASVPADAPKLDLTRIVQQQWARPYSRRIRCVAPQRNGTLDATGARCRRKLRGRSSESNRRRPGACWSGGCRGPRESRP